MVSIASDEQFLSIQISLSSLPIYSEVGIKLHFAKIIKCLYLGFSCNKISNCKGSYRNIAIIQKENISCMNQ